MKKQTGKKSKLWIWLVGLLVLLLAAGGVTYMLLSGGGQEGEGSATEPPATTAPVTDPALRADLYWNIDRIQFTENSETGLSTREPAEDGQYHIRFAYNGEIVDLIAADKKVVNIIDTLDVMGLEFDADGQIVKAIQPLTIAMEVGKRVYVQYVDGDTIITNSSLAMNGMEMPIKVTDLTGIYEVDPTSENLGKALQPSDLKPFDSVTIYANMNGDNTHVYVLSHAESSKMYFRVEQWYNSSEQKTTREPNEDGVYSIDFFCDGELVTLHTKDAELLRKIDSLYYHNAYTGLTFDENGLFDGVMEVSVGLGGMRNVYCMEVDSVEGRTANLINIYNSNGPSEQTVTLPESCPIYDLSMAAEAEGRRGKAVDMVVPGDRITVWSDMQGNPILAIITLHRVDLKPYYSPSRKYNSVTHETTREPDANGYYSISLVAEGEGQKTYRIKDKAVATYIDRYAERTVGIVTEGDVIVRAYDYESIFGYTRFCTALWVDSINGTIISASSGNGASVYNTIMSPDCKVIDVTDTTVPGAKTELKVGDRIIAFRDTNKEVCLIWAAGRTFEGSDFYVNVTRKYDSTKKETTRTPDEDGYYVFDMTNRGKQVTVKTKSKDLASKIDSYGVRVMGMYVRNGIAQQAFYGGHVTGGWIDLYNGVVTGKPYNNLIPFHNEGKPEQTYEYEMIDGYQCYNISTAVDSFVGEKSTPKVGDKIMIYNNRADKGVVVFILNRPLHKGLYWNKEPMYNGTTKTTARKPNAEGYYVFEMSYLGKMVTLKTKNVEIANTLDSNTYGVALNLKGDEILSVSSHSYATDIATLKYGAWDVDSISGNTVNLKFNRFADAFGNTAKFSKSGAKVYDVSPTAGDDFGKETTLRAGDRVRVYTDDNDNVTYVYIVCRDATRVAYCPHCDKEVLWSAWYGSNFDVYDGHHFLVCDRTIYTQYTCGTASRDFEAVLDLNGHTLTRNGDGRMLLAIYGDELTILDTVGGGTIQGMGGLGSLGNIALVTEGAKINLMSGTLKNIGTEEMASARGGVVYVYGDESEFNMYGGEIIGGLCKTDEKYTTSFGSMYIYKGTFNMHGGIVRDGQATMGGNIYLADKGKFNMTGGTIIGGEAYKNGGNIYASTNTVMNISGGEITGGLSHNVAGNLFATANSTLTITGGTITGGVAQPELDADGKLKSTYGGNIYLDSAAMTVNGGTISNGDASRGGNINIGGNSVLNIAAGTITGGKAEQGGNIRIASAAPINMTGGAVTNGTTTNTGGNIFMGFGAKLNVTGGTISGGGMPAEGATTTCKYGGNVYVYGGDSEINISKGATVTGGYAKGNGANICIATVSDVAGKLNVDGGILDGGVQVSKETVVTVSGAAKIGNRQNGVNLLSGSKLVLGNLTQGAEICVNADGAFTVANAKAAEYLAAGYIKGISSAMTITEKDGVLYANKPSEDIFNGVYEKAVAMTEKGTFDKGGIVEAECPYCGTTVQWEPLPELTSNEVLTLGSSHYYLAKNANYNSLDKAKAYYEIDLNAAACLHLNGQNIESGNRSILVRVGAKLNVMGDGIVKGAGFGVHKNFNGGALDMLGATVNLCGGTYMTTGATPILSTRSEYVTTLGIFNGTTIQGAETNTISSLYLYGAATVNMYGGTIADGTATGNYGGNVYMSDKYATEFNLYGGTVTGGTSNQGGNFRVAKGKLNVYGGSIENGSSTNTGGNVFLLVGATLNLENGTIVGGNAATNGGNIYVYGDNTVNISGGEVTGGTSANNGGKNLYFQKTGEEIATFTMSGGSIENSVYVNACNVTLSGAPTIGAANGGLYIADGLKLTLGDLTAGTEIFVTANGVFTNANTKAADYLAAGYFKGATGTITITEKDGVLIAGRVSESVAYQDVYEKAQKMTQDGVFASNGAVEAVCPYCGETVTWEPLPALTAEKLVLNQSAHYYLASNVSYDSTAYAESFYEIDGKASICLHLNGQTITSGNRSFFIRIGSKLNVMGDGTVQGAGFGVHKNFNGAAFDMLGATVNLCGGTYKTTGATPIISTRSEYQSTLNIYDGTIQGAETNTISSLYLYGKAVVNMSGGTITGGTAAGNYGGNVYMADKYSTTFNLYDGVITGGTSNQGGNFRVAKGTVNISGGTVTAGNSTGNGGNIFLFGGATLNMTAGTVENGAAPAGSGGNIYVYGAGTVSVSGNASVSGATAKNGGGKNVYFQKAGEETSKLIMNGGAIANSVVACANTTIELSGAPTIGAANGALYMVEGAKIVMGELTEGTEIYITASGIISEPHVKAAEYLAAGYFKGATAKHIITEDSGILIVTEVSQDEILANAYEEAKKMTEDEVFASNETVEAMCPVCYKTVTWQPLPALTEEKLVLSEHAHYYLASNVDYDSQAYEEAFYELDNRANICLHLNGQTITSGNRTFFPRVGTVLNVMGDGTVQGAGFGVHKNFNGGAFDMLGATVNLFGGTYKTIGAAPIISTRSEYQSTLNIYDGTIQGAETNTISSLYLYGKATVNMYGGEITGGTATGNYGGNVYMADKYATEFNMYDGTVSGGTSNQGGNFRVAAGTLNVYGGTITAGNSTGNGGNIFLLLDATLNMEAGSVTNGAAPAGSGGNIYTWGSNTVKLSGNATVSGATAKNGGGKNLYMIDAEGAGGKLIMNGGSFENSVFVGAKGSVELSGAPTIGAGNGGLYLLEGAKITLGEMAEGTEVYVTASATGAISTANAKASDYLAAGYFKATSKKIQLSVVENALYATVMSDSDMRNEVSEKADEMATEFASNAATVEATCPYCDKTVTWEVLPALTEEILEISGNKHYYLASNVEYDSQSFDEAMYQINSSAVVCLHLNGQTVISGNRAFSVRQNATLNVMGSGTVQGAGAGRTYGGAFDLLGGNLNLMGGTYMTTGASSVISTRGVAGVPQSTISIYNGTTVKGTETNTISNLSLHGETVVNMYGGTITGGTATGNYGGNIHMGSEFATTLNLYDGTITGGTSDQGGNIYMNGMATVNLMGGTVEDGTANQGGNIRISGGTVNITGATVTGGTAKTNNGGNVFLLSGATLNVEGGKVQNGAAPAGNGGNIFAYGNNTVKISGDATVTGGTSKNGGGKNIYFMNYDGAGAKLIMNGGTIQSSVYISTLSTVELSGAPVIGSANGGLYVESGVKIALGELTDGTEVYVTAAATGAISTATEKAADYLAANYFKATTKKTELSVVENALYATVLSDEDLQNQVNEKANEMATEFASNAAAVEATCPYCDKVVTWKVLPALTEEKLVITEGAHYYLASNVSYDSTAYADSFYELDNKVTVCLHLNGQTINSGNRAFAIRQECVLNVMGDGTVQGAGAGQHKNFNGGAFDLLKGTVNLCGGTYKTTGATPIISTRGADATYVSNINIYNGTTIQGAETNTISSLYLYGAATVNMYGGEITGGTATGNYGGNVYMADKFATEFNMYDGTVSGGTSNQGGNFRVAAGTLNVYGGTITAGNSTGNGGNIFLLLDATLNMEAGSVTNGAAPAGSGGNIYTWGSNTVKLSGNATVSGATAKNGGGKNLYMIDAEGAGGKLIMNGGSFENSVFVGAKGSVELSGAPTIGAGNGGLYLLEGAKITMGELTANTKIMLTAVHNGAIAEANANAEAYLSAGYFEAIGSKTVLSVVDNVLTATQISEVDFNNSINEKANAMTDTFAAGGAVEAECPLCDRKVTWEALPTATAEITLLQSKHYYLAAGVDYTANTFRYSAENAGKICLFLNGQTLSNTAGRTFWVNGETTLNVMGSGTVTGKGEGTAAENNFRGAAFDVNNGATLNLMGGTYNADAAAPAITTRDTTASVINMYKGTTIQGATTGSVTNVLLNGAGSFNMYDGVITGGKGTTALPWFGGNVQIGQKDAVLNVYGGEITDGTAGQGGNIRITSGVVNIDGGKVSGGKATVNGGNVFMAGGTLNVKKGSILNGDAANADPAKLANGGNIYTYGVATVSISSAATVEGGTSTNSVGKNIYMIKDSNSKGGKLVLNGAAMEGGIYAGTPTTVELSGKVTVGDKGYGIYMAEGVQLTLGELAAESQICVRPANLEAAFTKETANAATYAAYFKSAVTGRSVIAKENALWITSAAEEAALMTEQNVFASGEKVTAVCPVCCKEVEWTPLTGAATLSTATYATGNHFYLAADVQLTGGGSIKTDTTIPEVCLHLNGKSYKQAATATNAIGALWVVADTELTVMGEGTVVGAGYEVNATRYLGGAIDARGTVNIYGGTYMSCSTAGRPAVTTMTKGVINMYAGTIQRNPDLTVSNLMSGNVWLDTGSDDTQFNMYGGTITGGSALKGGNVYMTRGAFLLDGGTIEKGVSTGSVANDGHGGANVHMGGGTFTMKSGTITEGTSTLQGGNVRVDAGTFTMEGGTVSYGTAANLGGNFRFGGSKTVAVIKGGQILGGYVPSSGGSIAVVGAKVTITGGVIDGSGITQTKNASTGGLMYINSGNVEVGGTAVLKNGVASGSGNGIYVNAGANLAITGGALESTVYMNATGNVTLSGAAKVSNLDLTKGAKMTLGALTDGAEIIVTATAGNEITVANDAIATLKNYIKSATTTVTFEVTTTNTLKAVEVAAG